MLKKLLLVLTIVGGSISYAGEKSVQLSILPEFSLGATKEDSISKFSFNILGAINKDVTGLDLSLVGLRTVEGDFVGSHLSLIPIEKFTVKGDLYGGSLSLWNDINGKVNGRVFGVVNTVNEVNGSALGLVNLVNGNTTSVLGIFNKVEGQAITTTGLITIVKGNVNNQFGLFNRAETVTGLQFGVINSTRNLDGVQIGLLNHATNGILPVLPLVNFRKTL